MDESQTLHWQSQTHTQKTTLWLRLCEILEENLLWISFCLLKGQVTDEEGAQGKFLECWKIEMWVTPVYALIKIHWIAVSLSVRGRRQNERSLCSLHPTNVINDSQIILGAPEVDRRLAEQAPQLKVVRRSHWGGGENCRDMVWERDRSWPLWGEGAKVTEGGKGWTGTWRSVWERQVPIAIGLESKRGRISWLLARS